MPDTDIAATDTDTLIAEWRELRGEFGTAIADAKLPTDERLAREARLQAVDLELKRRKARPLRRSKAPGFRRTRTGGRRGIH